MYNKDDDEVKGSMIIVALCVILTLILIIIGLLFGIIKITTG